MKMEQAQFLEYIHRLCSSIKKSYLEAYNSQPNYDRWFIVCQEALRDFVLSRPDWKRGSQNPDEVIFKGKYTIDTHIILDENTGTQMIRIATGIAKAEIIDNDEIGNPIREKQIEEAIGSEDWIIPFVTRRT